MNGTRVFAVVVNFNGAEVTHACVASLRASREVNLRILVVDNASNEVDRNCLQSDWGETRDVEVLYLPRNGHFAGGINAGALRALEEQASHLFFLNNDTVIEPDCIARLVRDAEQHPEAGLVGPALLDLGDRRPLSMGENYAPWSLAVPRSLLRVRTPGETSYRVGGIMGSAILVTADCFLRLGPYREDLLVYYEEVDYCLRARAAGFQPRLVPDAVVLHDGMRGFTAGLQPYAARLKTRNQLRLALDHGGLGGFLIFLPFFLALVVASSVLYAFRGDGATVRALWSGVAEGFGWLWRGHP